MRLLLTVLALSLAAGCSRLPVLPPPDDAALQAWQQHDIRLNAINKWTVRGRFSLKSDSDTWTGTLHWQQDGDHYSIQLSSPLGQGLIRLSGDPDNAVLEAANGARYLDDDAQTLFKRTLGWALPLKSLRHWLLGRPRQNIAFSYLVDAEGHITRLHQQNWQVIYKEYHPLSPALPRRLDLQGRDLRIKLVVDQWTDLDNTLSR